MQKLSEFGDLLEIILDAIPSPIFVVDRDVRIIGLNEAASRMLEGDSKISVPMRAGEALHCIRSTETVNGCGGADACKDCVIRCSVNESFTGNSVVRQRERMNLARGHGTVEIHLLVTTAPLRYRDELLVLLILEDITKVIKLKSILPVCSHCKRIRDDRGYWDQIETYLSTHSGAQFSHSMCPECARELYPELFGEDDAQSRA